MRIHTIFTLLLLSGATLLASCQAPPPLRYDRPLNSMKFHAGGYNHNSRNHGHGHGHKH